MSDPNNSRSKVEQRRNINLSRRRVLQAAGGLGATGMVGMGKHNAVERTVAQTHPPSENDDVIRVLFLGGSEDGSHNPSERSKELIPYLLNRGIEVFYTDRKAALESDTLHQYDAWMLYGNRSNLTQKQENSLVNFVENGGGFIGLHSASASFTESEQFISHLGGQFDRHGTGEMTEEYAEPEHPILDGLNPIESWDETYRHINLNPNNTILSYGDFPDYGENEDREPWTWVRDEGDGRVFYTAWGHDDRTWGTDGFKQLVENAIRWTSGNEETIAEETRTLDELEFLETDVPYYPADEEDTVPEDVGEGMEWERMQHPLEPSESLEHTITPAEFDLEQYVSEEVFSGEITGNMLDIDFDAQGRCWVSLSADYPNHLGEGRDKIVICEDTDGDGQADEFTTFAEGLSIPTSLTVVDEGVIVCHLEENNDDGSMLYLEDTNGNGQADVEEELFSGFGTGDTHAGPNQITYGIDNWIWGQVGYSGFEGTVGGEEYEFNSAIYRFRPDGSELEVVAELPGNQAGIEFNEEGLAFASAATAGQPSNYVSIPQRYYNLVNGFSAPMLSTIADSNRFLPITDRVRQVDQHGGFTAATDHEIYTAREYPQKYWNQAAFIGDGTGHLLSTFFLEQDGAGYSSHYPYNLAASKDEWFSPTYAEVGPDGMVWFIDWYNFIFQHNPTPESYETGEGNAYVTDLRDNAHARIYRATYGDDINSQPQDLSGASPCELVDTLTNDNMFWRLTAQRLLVERCKQTISDDEYDIVSNLIDLVNDESVDELGINPGAIHALWTLQGLGVLTETEDGSQALEATRGALVHPSGGVRLNAVRVLPGSEATREAILENDLLTDDDPRVQMWALLKLAETPESIRAGEAVYGMISKEDNASDTLLVDAASAAGAQHAEGFITRYEEQEDNGDDEDGNGENLLTNPSFEDGTNDNPEGWETNTWGGSAEFSYVSREYSGENSVRVDSSEGGDASWGQVVSVEPNTEYTFSAWVQTEDLEADDAYGALLNVHELGEVSTSNAVDGTTDWTKVETTVNSGNNEELTFNALFGGFGTAIGTAWFDDASLVQTRGGGLQTVYERVQQHLDGGDDNDDNGTIDSMIELEGEVDGWQGVSPGDIEGETNPTFSLEAGEDYTVEWTNADGVGHNFVVVDNEGDELVSTDIMSEEGETQTIEFTASEDMAEYFCQPHPDSMQGAIEIVDGDNRDAATEEDDR